MWIHFEGCFAVVSGMLNKAPDQLIMNQADSYRQTQEQRYLIDRTIPVMDYGKGCKYAGECVSRCLKTDRKTRFTCAFD